MPNPTVDTFFDNTGGGVGAPSASIKVINDFVYGEVVDQAMVDKKKFASDDVEVDKRTGEPIQQLVVILQTELRNYSGVAKRPTNEDGSPKADSEDDGRRAIYVAPFTNIHAAIGDAIKRTNDGKAAPIRNGAMLGVKIVDLKDTGKGNPLKIHAATYTPPAASGSEFFGEAQTAQQAAPAQSAPPAQQTPPPAAPPAQSAPAQQDPWSGQPAVQKDPWGAPQEGGQTKPPF